MTTTLNLETKKLFPCPVCREPLDVRTDKKLKLYVICDSCGLQMFVRRRSGIDALNELLEGVKTEDIWGELAFLKKRYRKECPDCGRKFWVAQNLVKTDWITGVFLGFRCPREGCGALVKWEGES